MFNEILRLVDESTMLIRYTVKNKRGSASVDHYFVKKTITRRPSIATTSIAMESLKGNSNDNNDNNDNSNYDNNDVIEPIPQLYSTIRKITIIKLLLCFSAVYNTTRLLAPATGNYMSIY